jgi:hypothetical protein
MLILCDLPANVCHTGLFRNDNTLVNVLSVARNVHTMDIKDLQHPNVFLQL